MPQTINPIPLKTHYGVQVSTAVIEIVAPAANTKGVRISFVDWLATVAGAARLMSKTTAPSGYTDTAARSLASCGYAAGYIVNNVPAREIAVPAGEGVYVHASAVNSFYLFMSYQVLT